MSEEEIIKILNKMCEENWCIEHEKVKQAIERFTRPIPK